MTTDPGSVGGEVARLYKALYQRTSAGPIEQAFDDLSGIYLGKHPDYKPCDTEYHDLQHVLDVTLAMARLMDGYERSRNGFEPLPADLYVVGVVVALFHDFGYIRRRGDRRHKYGAEYTLTHVSRGSVFLRGYLHRIGLGQYARAAGQLVHYTGYERPAETIRVSDPILRRVGHILGTADIIGQMSDRCYLEKCRDRLYPEFVLGGIALGKDNAGNTKVRYSSGLDLLRTTPEFFEEVMSTRLDGEFAGAYRYLEVLFNGRNPYMDAIRSTLVYLEKILRTEHWPMLRRDPPCFTWEKNPVQNIRTLALGHLKDVWIKDR